MVLKLLMIAVGGGVGALLRYALAGWGQGLAGDSFPAGTLLVNAVGCLAIGVLGAAFAGPHMVREEYRVALLVGVLGAFTTFSTFGWETMMLANDGQFRLAALNVILSNGIGLTAVWLGYRLATRWFGA